MVGNSEDDAGVELCNKDAVWWFSHLPCGAVDEVVAEQDLSLEFISTQSGELMTSSHSSSKLSLTF